MHESSRPAQDQHVIPDPSSGATALHEPDTCCICLETISERAVAVPCNHLIFDFICLASWVQEHPKCPLCNTVLTAIEYDWRGPNDFKRYRLPAQGTTPTASASHYNVPRWQSRQLRGNDRWRPYHRPQPSYNRPTTSTDEAALSQRRHIYRHNLFSQHIGSNRHSRFRDFTPSSFARSSDLQSRARTFLRRELGVFDFSNQTIEFMLTYTLSILRTVELKHSSGKAQELLAEFLGEVNASLFCHELESWLRSPFTKLQDWDRWVQYAEAVDAAQKT